MATTTTNPTSSATAAAPSPPGEGAPPPPPLFSLGLIADIQYADMADSHVEVRTQRFSECPGKLEAALSAIRSEGAERNPSRLAAVLTLGDMINGNREDASRNPSDLETVASLIDAAFPPGGDVPVFHILGNHCLDLPKRRVTERLAFPPSALLLPEEGTAAAAAAAAADGDDGAGGDGKRESASSAPPACYSVLLRPGWRLVALDTTEMSGHAQDSSDSARAREAREYLKTHPLTEGEEGSNSNPQMSPWNGGPGSQQVEWLRRELGKAAENKERVVVAGHHQVGPGECVRRSHAAWNWREVSEVVSGGRLKNGKESDPSASSFKTPAVLYLAGHDHTGGYARAGGVHFLTLEAIVEAPSGSNAFAVLDFHEDKIVVRGFGSATSRVLDLA